MSLLLPACSFAFVDGPRPGALTNPQVSLDCTTSRTLPLVDAVLGVTMASAVAAVTYAGVERINNDCGAGSGCYTPWKPALLAAFLAISPWGLSAARGFADTGRCRAAYRVRQLTPP